jgi:hypothetical protein
MTALASDIDWRIVWGERLDMVTFARHERLKYGIAGLPKVPEQRLEVRAGHIVRLVARELLDACERVHRALAHIGRVDSVASSESTP